MRDPRSRDADATRPAVPAVVDDGAKADIVVGRAAAVEVGEVLDGRHRIDALLGSGGMADVFRAYDLRLRTNVAVKVLLPKLARDPQMEARFVREARSASRLDHPNCLRVDDFGITDAGVKYMVMPLLEGEDLRALLGRPLAPRRAIDLIVQILAGLEHAHAAGIVHRDLKPANVFVTRDYEGREVLKIMDFGIAKIVSADDGATRLTQQGMIFGTPRYMSPEQATGVPVDERADLYAVGVLLYEALAGRPPFEADDTITMLRMQVCADPPPLPDGVPGELAGVVVRLLAKHRDSRYESARAARVALERVRAGLRLDARGAAPATSAIPTLPTGGLDPVVGRRVADVAPRAAPVAAAPASAGARPDAIAAPQRVLSVSGPHVHPGAVLRVDHRGTAGAHVGRLRRGSWLASGPARLIMLLALIPAYRSRPVLAADPVWTDVATLAVRVAAVWLICTAFGLVLWRLLGLARGR